MVSHSASSFRSLEMDKVRPWTMSQQAKRDRASRSHRWIDARVRSRHQPEVPAIISNISEAGCCIEASAGFEAGEEVEIVVPRLGSIAAMVRWSHSGHSGAVFVIGSGRWLVPDPEAANYAPRMTAQASSPHGV